MQTANWIVTRDYLGPFDAISGAELPKLNPQTGEITPSGLEPQAVEIWGPRQALRPAVAELERRFVLADDDGFIYCEGVANDDAEFEPLDMFGMPNAGATIIAYLNGATGRWEPL